MTGFTIVGGVDVRAVFTGRSGAVMAAGTGAIHLGMINYSNG